jgi:hypothetical protein
VAPGVVLQAVRLRDVILASGTMNYRLGLGGTAVPDPAAGASRAAHGRGSLRATRGAGAPQNALGGPLITEAQQQAMGQHIVAGLDRASAAGR